MRRHYPKLLDSRRETTGRTSVLHCKNNSEREDDGSASRNAKPMENCCPDLLNDECSYLWRGVNYGAECIRTSRQRLHLDSGRGHSESHSSRAYRMADRTASASTL